MNKLFILLLFIAVSQANILNAQCEADVQTKGYTVKRHNGIFTFYCAYETLDSLIPFFKIELKNIKATDTIFWQWENEFPALLSAISINRRRIKVHNFYFEDSISYRNQKIIPEYTYKSNKMKRKSGRTTFYKHGVWGFSNTYPGIENKLSHIVVSCSDTIFNPAGPAARKLAAIKKAFSEDSLLSLPLANLKKNILLNDGGYIWDVASAQVVKWNKDLLADQFQKERELHLVELYVEENRFWQTTVHSRFNCQYPGLFGEKQVASMPFYKRNGIRGFQQSWYTFPMLQLRIDPDIVPGTPVLIVVRKSRDIRTVGNFLYPETLWTDNETFADIYSKPKPVERAKTLLGNLCIDSSKACDPEWIMLAAREWFGKANCYTDTIVTFDTDTTSKITGDFTVKYPNFIVVMVQEKPPVKLNLRTRGSEKWNSNNLYPMYDYPDNMIFNASGTLRNNHGFSVEIPVQPKSGKGWLLIFSKENMD